MVFVFYILECCLPTQCSDDTIHIALQCIRCQFLVSSDVRCSRHIRKQQILFHRQFEDKQEFEKETNKSFIVHIPSFHRCSTQHSTISVCRLRYYICLRTIFFFIHFEFHFHCLRISSVCLCSWILFQVLFLVLCAFPFSFWQKKSHPNDCVGRHTVKWIICHSHTSAIHFVRRRSGSLTVLHRYCIVWTCWKW